ncbi:AbrB family transcriptional regulator [Thermosynechococcaceae cyanobacterium BACA0444]|uniref:AbrB family transcriptional regulator n=1 Tax=Pseudocalidococcus azoricus BACA0444 TaxID=2918990 RepID=A0AAE4FS48_9CYAN|nr:AbrB family transcriptional regulator [Pseudocalidococcus azoricus]MDS3861318.1 AbrB family transcriptional regulator [Pseudocalidococcus azoricus BACA0444]
MLDSEMVEKLKNASVEDRIAVIEVISPSKEEIAKAGGYYTTTKGGSERVSTLKFYKGLADAQGLNLDGKSALGSSRGGRSASYRISVQANGDLLIGSAYTKQMNLKPGDEFEISLGSGHIKLTQVSEEDAADLQRSAFGFMKNTGKILGDVVEPVIPETQWDVLQ